MLSTMSSSMWDRLRPLQQQQQYDQKAVVVASNVTVDSTTRLGVTFTNYSTGYSYSIRGGPLSSKPPREVLAPRYPPHESSPEQEPPPRNPNRLVLRGLNSRRASIYSQPASPAEPSHPANLASRQTTQSRGASIEISPPSSPEPEGHHVGNRIHGRRGQIADVSPIEEDPNDMAPRAGVDRPGVPSRESPLNQNPTSIPMMRRARRKQSDAALRDALSRDRQDMNRQHRDEEREDIRWDPMTGERTKDTQGRPSQVKPAEYAQGLGISPSGSPTLQTRPTAPPSFGDRVRKMAQTKPGDMAGQEQAKRDRLDPATAASSTSRPGWRGASGRTALVDPVRDYPSVAPLRIPQKLPSRNVTPVSLSGPNMRLPAGLPSRGQTPPISPPAAGPSARTRLQDAPRKSVPLIQTTTPSPSASQFEEQSYPSPPLSSSLATPTAPTLAARELTNDIDLLPSQSPTAAVAPRRYSLDKTVIRRKATPQLVADHQPQKSVSSLYSQQTPEPSPPSQLHPALRNTIDQGIPAADDGWVQPPSRFSVSTYATSANSTPHDFGDDFEHDRPPMPSVPALYHERAKPKPDSVMDRKRPIPGRNNSSGDAPIPISFNDSPYMSFTSATTDKDKRPPAHPAIARAQATGRDSRRVSMEMSMKKSLPPPPPETKAGEAQDRVGLLNAQLRSLANRRINLNRSIKQMTELMPMDNLLASDAVQAKREAEKRKVAALRDELADVQREEYELGLKLHMAYKRMDRDADWEPTTLWVRRVTG